MSVSSPYPQQLLKVELGLWWGLEGFVEWSLLWSLVHRTLGLPWVAWSESRSVAPCLGIVLLWGKEEELIQIGNLPRFKNLSRGCGALAADVRPMKRSRGGQDWTQTILSQTLGSFVRNKVESENWGGKLKNAVFNCCNNKTTSLIGS